MHPMLAMFRRNAWANERLLEFCGKQPPDIVTAVAGKDVYGGVDALLTHIVAAETGYLPLITGERRSARMSDAKPLPLGELLEPARWSAERWPGALDFDRDPEEVLRYQRGRDREWMTDWLPLVQCIHHGDDHRTQVATLLGRQGVETPELDGWAFGEITEAPDGSASDGSATDRRSSVLRRCFGHHLWATELLLQRCTGLSPEQLALSTPGTYGSIGDTLDHLVSSDRSYLARLRGGTRQPPLDAGGPGPLLEHLARQSEDWLSYLDTGPDFDAVILRRDGGQSPAWVVVMQAIHHGNDHRTHVGTVLLHHDLEVPELGAWEYGLAVGALQVLG